MLHLLFGNRSIEKALFFLLINGRCYAGKLARHFRSPLTPIQQGLLKLELIGILTSTVEGKVRYYQFNPDFPLLTEFETLLRKAYTLLPGDEKRIYFDPEIKPKLQGTKSPAWVKGLVINVWSKLKAIKWMSFTAVSLGQEITGWNGTGKGHVHINQENDHRIIFYETGSWLAPNAHEFTFTNTFRWTFDRFKNLITLEHLRFGEQNPVFLFDLAQSDEQTLESVSSHVFQEDTYLGKLHFDKAAIQLNWRIIGPKMNGCIHYIYT